ncbi:MAG TPA: VWA domain-containing protein, partial [Spirochaetota bacterium]|nr:VWA domain-containing protein [Spirochaetota bacterium]
MFEYNFVLWFLFLVPIIFVLFIFEIISLRKRVKIVAGKNLNTVIPYYSEGQKYLRMVFYTLGIILTVFALARPRWGVETINSDVEGRDIIVLLDTSYSMATPDVIPNRLEAAKRGIEELLETERGDRVGLMVFSGDAELLTPLTLDYGAISFFLESVYPNMLPKDGTNIAGAILKSFDAFYDAEPRSKMILLFTDGENLEGDYYSMLQKLKESNIKVFTIGVGTQNGEPIPIRNEKGEVTSYLKDNSGKHVISRLDEKRLLEIAQTSSGSYLRSSGRSGEIKRFIESINTIEKKNMGKLSTKQKKERYDIFLIPALILFALGFILDQGKIMKFKENRFNIFLNKSLTILIILFLSVSFSYAASDETGDSKQNWIGDPNGGFWGNKAFKKEDYNKALGKYKSAENSLKGDDLGKLYYNLGNTYYKLNNLPKSKEYHDNAGLFLKEDKFKGLNFYN